MCGLVGIVTSGGNDFSLQTLEAMTASLHHRGPDSRGVWIESDHTVGLGSVRLAILDLRDGRQPMVSHGERFVIAYNGEIYNFAALRRELEDLGVRFKGRSDTEVVLAAVEQWGVEEAVCRFNGMFAIALWDRVLRQLYLARDRLGEKPLYYLANGRLFMCASELKALRKHPAFQVDINPHALAFFVRYGYILEPQTIYRGVYKLPPGTILRLSIDRGSGELRISEPKPYWSAGEVIDRCLEKPFAGDEAQAVDELERLLTDAVRLRMVADVPVGAMLSGGVDSSTIVALMQAVDMRRVKTFTLGFSDSSYDEAPYAAKVARYLGTDHTEQYVSGSEAAEALAELPNLFDEPFGDYSQLPTYLLARLARKQVVVVLTGEGGDELFGGYERYVTATGLWRAFGWMPSLVKGQLASMLSAVSPESWERVLSWLNHLLPGRLKQARLGEKMHKLAEVLEASSRETLYFGLLSHWSKPEAVLSACSGDPGIPSNGAQYPARLNDWLAFAMYVDLVSYLPGDILAKVDRATMGVSLEGRMPFLDHRVVEFAWRLPLRMKIRRGRTKHLLRKLLYKYVPRQLVERPKMGFGAPIGMWLRGPMRDWAESLLSEERIKRYGLLKPTPVRQLWQEHLTGRRNWQHRLWIVLMLQAWCERWL